MEYVSTAEEAEETRSSWWSGTRQAASDAEPKVAVPVGGNPSSEEWL